MVLLSRHFRKDKNIQEVFCWKLDQLSMNSIHSSCCSDAEYKKKKKTRKFVSNFVCMDCGDTSVVFSFTSNNSCCVGVNQ